MVLVVAMALLFWTCVFAAYFTSRGVSPLDFFLGAREPYDHELARWRPTASNDPSSGLREERYVLPNGDEGASHLEHQVRYRDPATGSVARVEPTRRVRRVRSRSVRS
ncbi:MAG TPA: hypothetical protein VHB79_07955 [Polyangiaceae bacterium]|nr:hypothetical protein [Polyangiaceae bacterium]